MKHMHRSLLDVRRLRAQLLRQLADGLITNDEFQERWLDVPEQSDAEGEIFDFAWSFYDDLYTHRLRGPHRLSPLQRRVFARCVLFLRSGLEYRWPARAKWLWCRQAEKVERSQRLPWWMPDASVLASIPILGARWLKKWMPSFEAARDRKLKAGTIVDDRIWPFRTMAEYRAALAAPVYLAGRSTF